MNKIDENKNDSNNMKVSIFDNLLESISLNKNNIKIKGVAGSSVSVLIFKLFKKLNRPVFYLTNDIEKSSYVYTDLYDTINKNLNYFPSRFRKSSNKIEDKSNILSRTKILNEINQNKNQIYVLSSDSIIEKVPNIKNLSNKNINIKRGLKLNLTKFVEDLFGLSFIKRDFVHEPGEFSSRGNILDIFSFSNTNPIRIEFDDDLVESVREFDINTQLSIKNLNSIKIAPNIFNNRNEVFFNQIKKESILIIDDINAIVNTISKNNETEDYSLNEHEFKNSIENFQKILITEYESQVDLTFKTSPQPAFNKRIDMLNENLNDMWAKDYKINLFYTNESQKERLQQLLTNYRKKYEFKLVKKSLFEGFIDHDEKKVFYSDHQIFNRFHKFKISKVYSKAKTINIDEINKLKIDDYVTHIDHGIGIYKGLTKIENNGKKQEAIKLSYGEGDVIYLSIHLFHKISKFNSKDGAKPRIYKLGSGAWDRIKNKAKTKIKELAFDLIKTYAKRKISKGFKYKKDSWLQNELEASFLFVETEDQIKANEQVKMDMESENPMDRLICGDVGFGKTEIAIRAAFKAIDNGRQVAFLVPTTILAFQHYKTFKKRFENFPISFDYLNRFRTNSDKNIILDNLKTGKLDLIVGTHQLVNEKVLYDNLGLLVVDEEQKFGVNVKERIRSMKENIDVLTLTATPIPRTLQYSLMSARDLSIINTPPLNRVPIQTEIIRFDKKIIRDAILYELQRGGQIFFVHNKIENILDFGELLKGLVPEAIIKIAHSKIGGNQLENIMLEFINNEFDILVSTTIIESGLDVPNANTIFINNAQNFGLSDLHQIRGRVGRSNKNAYCYFITPESKSLTVEAKKRINAINQYNQLGAGFNIAMKDLEIRGAGNLLGGEQSGFINDIGFDTYQKILNEAVEELKSDEFKKVFQTKNQEFSNTKEVIIDTDHEILFPNSYVPQIDERLSLYKELSKIENEKELNSFKKRIVDRFGKIPKESKDLINSIKLKWIARTIGFEKIVLKNKKMICYFISNKNHEYFNSKTFVKILKTINQTPYCKLKEKNKLYVVFENIGSVGEALKNLNIF